jgi:hypothetical protein
MTVIMDAGNAEDRNFKKNAKNLSDEEHEIIFSLTADEQDALLTLENSESEWNVRYKAGNKLPDEILKMSQRKYHFLKEKSIPSIILRERRL